MKILRPFVVTTSNLTSSNVVETPPAAYNAGTAYLAGEQVSVFGGVSNTTATLYESLQNANTGHTPASSPLWWQPIGTAYLAYNPATGYAQGATVTDTTNHLLYESINPSTNTGHALSDPAWWVLLGPSNRWAMFDGETDTQTIRPLMVKDQIDVLGRADTVSLINIDAASVNITVMDGASEAYNEDYSLISDEGIIDWAEYYFEPVIRMTDLAVSDLPNVLDPSIIITATDGDDVKIGNCKLGLSAYVGDAVYGASVGRTSYSKITRDDFGKATIIRRGYYKRGRFSVVMPSGLHDFVYNLLSEYDGLPIVMIGTDQFTSTHIYGLLKDWGIGINYVSHSVMNIEIEGL